MSNITVRIIVEGKTEQIFIEKLLCPYFAAKGIFLSATQASKKGQNGGDIRFDRVKLDIRNCLRQQPDVFVSTLIDYYGVKQWPEYGNIPPGSTPGQIAERLNTAAKKAIVAEFPGIDVERRFIPFMAIHEFEALLFSDSAVLAEALGVKTADIDGVLTRYSSPEAINNSPATAPSKRLKGWSGKYGKTSTGIAIAEKIGIDKMRTACPLFGAWLKNLEQLKENRLAGDAASRNGND